MACDILFSVFLVILIVGRLERGYLRFRLHNIPSDNVLCEECDGKGKIESQVDLINMLKFKYKPESSGFSGINLIVVPEKIG